MARKDVSTLRDEAAAAVGKGKFRQALELYVELEKRQPADPSWPKRVGEIHRRLGDNDEAVVAFDRSVDKYVSAGFLVQAIAVCKLILQIDPAHSATVERLAQIASPGKEASGPKMLPRGRKAPAAAVGVAPAPVTPPPVPPVPPPASRPRAAPPPPPPPREAPAQIHDRPPRRSAELAVVELPRGAALDAMSLSEVMPGARRLDKLDGTPSGISVIPLDAELELIGEQAFDSHTGIDAAIAAAALDEPILDEPDFALPDQDLLEMPSVRLPRAEPEERAPALDMEARRALLTTPLLAGLPPRVLESLVNRLALVELAAGHVLFNEGDVGDCLYIISEGEVVVETSAAGELARLLPGAFFGEVALITDLPRSASIRTLGACELLAIDRDVIRDLIAEHPTVLGVLLRFVRDRLIDRVMQTSELFLQFADSERRELSARFELVEVDPGTPLIVEGERADGLYVMLAGKVEVWRDESVLATLGPGEVFGEMSLLAGGGSVAHVRAATRALALRMPARTFREVIMTHPQVLAYVGDLAARRSGPQQVTDDMVDLRLDLF